MGKRSQFNSYVENSTAEFVRKESDRTGKSIGAIIDQAVELYSMEDLTVVRLRLSERLNEIEEPSAEDIDNLRRLKSFLDLYLGMISDA